MVAHTVTTTARGLQETTSDHDNVATKLYPPSEEGNSFVRKWMPYKRPSWPEANLILIRNFLIPFPIITASFLRNQF